MIICSLLLYYGIIILIMQLQNVIHRSIKHNQNITFFCGSF
nr:MAG TPA: hypothetical protein [Caudoviricetes sp.]